ncbi:MAG: Mur ligase family protein [Endomicrobiia bacterium]
MDYVTKFLNKFEKKEYIKKNYSLDNIKYFLSILGNPQEKLKNIIHITGTNGKGSVANYVSKMLENLGFKVGLYTSPHIFRVNERICINHKPISDKVLNNYLGKIYDVGLSPHYVDYMDYLDCLDRLTYFEILTCVMFLYFSEQDNDFNVLEVGLGGKLDATNVISRSLISVITKIGLDHTEVLGDTIRKITLDKSEIIKPNSYCVLSNNSKEVRDIVKNVCKKRNVKLKIFGNDFGIKNVSFKGGRTIWFDYYGERKINGLESYVLYKSQPENIAVSIAILELLKKVGKIKKFEVDKIRSATKINFPSRFEFIEDRRKHFLGLTTQNLIFDGSHNPLAIKNFVNTIKMVGYKNILLCFTMMKEKDYKSCIKILSGIRNRIKKVLVYELPLTRGQSISFLYKEFTKYFAKKDVKKFYKVSSVLKFIKNFAKEYENIIFVGSLYAEKNFFGRKINKIL